MNYKKLHFSLVGTIKDPATGEILSEQELLFSGTTPAIHGAIEKMGASFVYGLGVSLSREMLDTQKDALATK